MRRRAHGLARLAALLVAHLLLYAGAARAGNLSLTTEPAFSTGSSTSRDETGRSSETTASQLTQRYRLSLSQQLYPRLSLDAGAYYDWITGWSKFGELSSAQDARRWSGFARLMWGDPILNGELSYNRNQSSSQSTLAGVTTHAPSLIQENSALGVGWHPLDLPDFGLRLSHGATRDEFRKTTDSTIDQAQLSAKYAGFPNVDLRYGFNYANPVDHLHGVDFTDVTHSAAASWSGSFFDHRTSIAASINGSARTTSTTVSAKGGTVSTQQLPTAGFSVVEVLPATSAKAQLNSNANLIDGDVTSNAGLDIGFGPQLAGDDKFRDLGAQFADVVTKVNTIWVWVDRPLAGNGIPNVAPAFTWTAWKSDDNLNWTQVALNGIVQFNPFQNRFEIPITETQARYLKVVTRPLLPGVTLDARFNSILVTELQFFEVVAAQRNESTPYVFGGALTASLRHRIWQNLSYDASLSLADSSNSGRAPSYALTNGLSFNQQLARTLSLSARLERDDFDAGGGHSGQLQFGTSLAATLLPTVSGGINYSFNLSQNQGGNNLSQSVSLSSGVELYRGISLSGLLGYGTTTSGSGRTSKGSNVAISASARPHRTLTLTSGWSKSISDSSGGGQPSSSSTSDGLDGGVAFSPVPALSLSAGISHASADGKPPSNSANFSLGASPLRGGDLTLSFGYSEAIDTTANSRNRAWGPSARWNIRSGLFLSAGYSQSDSHAPAFSSSSRAFTVSLFAALL